MNRNLALLLLGIILMSCSTGRQEAKVTSEPLDDKASIHYDFAFDAYSNNELIPALSEALKAADLAPKSATVQNLLGLILFRQSKFGEAEAAFKKATSLDPKMSEAFNNLGTLFLAQKRYQDAKSEFLKAQDNPLYLYPERIQNNLGLAYIGLGQKPEAESAFRTAIQYRKDFYLPQMNLGRMLLESGKPSEAKEFLQDAAKLCSECAEPQYYLGQAYLKLKKPQEAQTFFRKGLDLDPKGSIGRLCEAQLTNRN